MIKKYTVSILDAESGRLEGIETDLSSISNVSCTAMTIPDALCLDRMNLDTLQLPNTVHEKASILLALTSASSAV